MGEKGRVPRPHMGRITPEFLPFSDVEDARSFHQHDAELVLGAADTDVV